MLTSVKLWFSSFIMGQDQSSGDSATLRRTIFGHDCSLQYWLYKSSIQKGSLIIFSKTECMKAIEKCRNPSRIILLSIPIAEDKTMSVFQAVKNLLFINIPKLVCLTMSVIIAGRWYCWHRPRGWCHRTQRLTF